MERDLSEKWCCSFEREQLLFEVGPAGVSSKRAIMPQHTMAGDYDRKVILMVRHTDRTRSAGLAQVPGNFAVAPRFPVWNFQQFTPDSDLKGSSGEIERKVELPSLTVKVFIDLLDKNPVRFVIHNAGWWNAVSKMHCGKAFFRGSQR